MTASHDGSVIYSHIARTDDNADASEVSTASASEDWKRHVTGGDSRLVEETWTAHCSYLSLQERRYPFIVELSQKFDGWRTLGACSPVIRPDLVDIGLHG